MKKLNNNHKQLLYIDMDDTLCDFKGAAKKEIERNPGIQFPQATYGFFANLLPITGAIEAVNILMKNEKYDCHIVTRPSYKNPLCYTEKRVWVEKYFGLDFCERLILISDKTLLKEGILIDDNVWEVGEGNLILFGSKDFPDWLSVLNYLDN